MASPNNAPTGGVTLVGSAIQGETLEAFNNLADLDGIGTIRYQWQVDGVSLEGQTETTLLVSQELVGKAITVRASYVDGLGTLESISSAAASANVAPTGGVAITGEATQKQTLSASNDLADADGMGTVSYQWLADGINIEGATDSTLLLTEAQVGKAISVKASYSDGHGSDESVLSAATASVGSVNDAPTGSVLISGSATQGQTLSASSTLLDPDGPGLISYQWRADDNPMENATSDHLTLTESEVGRIISVVASYTDGHGTLEQVASDGTAIVRNLNDAPVGSVSLAGKPNLGHLLSAANTLSDPDGLGAIGYQWLADGNAISGATAGTLMLGNAQVGKAISVTASYTDGHGTAESVTSSASTLVLATGSAPSIIALSPADGASGVAPDSNIRIVFDALLQAGTGALSLKNAAGTVLANYNAASSTRLSIDGNTLSIDPARNLDVFSSYRLEIDAGVVKDASGIAYAGPGHSEFTTQGPDSLYQIFCLAFDAAPGLAYMNQLAAAYNQGLSARQILNILTTKPEFTSTYAPSMTHQELASLLVNHIVKDSATPEARSEAATDIAGALDYGLALGDVLYHLVDNLAQTSVQDVEWGATAQQFQNQTAVARYFTEVMRNDATDLPTLHAVLGWVDPYTDVSTAENIAALIGLELEPTGP